ncbi:chymotrypsin-2-like [Colletes gigas]|uniref:chymotrypsin-2-like n=1 Tax=Colletes gigas TaxID=935657 RepID=UPI001C9B44F6|nr:chymotrypsin-2-like [Colletes gigas]
MNALAVLLVFGSVIVANGKLDPRIVGGQVAAWGKYPYQVSIRQSSRHICGGSIINKYFILTAAHCIYYVSADRIKVVVGSNYLKQLGVYYQAAELFYPVSYDDKLIIDDIGLIRVNGGIEFNELVQPILLAPVYDINPGETAVVTGWGRLSTDNVISNLLQEIYLTVISQEECKDKYWSVTETNICTLTKIGEGVCNGDSGGPMVVSGSQVGIVSYGYPCAKGYPDVYTRVYPYIDWINNITSQNYSTGNAVDVRLNKWTTLLLATATLLGHKHLIL